MLGVFVYISEVLIILSLPYLIISYDGHYKLVQTHTSPAVGQGEGGAAPKIHEQTSTQRQIAINEAAAEVHTIKDWK